MKGRTLAALTALNTAGLLALAGLLVLREPAEPAPTAAADAGRLAALEQRLAALERAARLPGAVESAGEAPAAAMVPAIDSIAAETTSGLPASGTDSAPAGASASAPPAELAADDDRPLRRSEVEALVRAQFARREEAAREAAKKAAPPPRPKRALPEVARELGLDARQESAVRELLRQIERDSLRLLFEVDEAGLETLKGELAQAEHDPRLKEQLRERLAVNWARQQAEIGVLWVRLDARLRETLGPELLQRFYAFEVHLEPREFPDIQRMFFAPPGEQR